MDEAKFDLKAHERAMLQDYKGAADILSEAIKKYPDECRLWNNRSYCFYKIKRHQKALEDAEEMVLRFPNYVKGYYRLGKAYCGLKLYKSAQEAFEKVLVNNKFCSEAQKELLNIKIQQLMAKNYSRKRAEWALRHYDHVEGAEVLLELTGANASLVGFNHINPMNPGMLATLNVTSSSNTLTEYDLRPVFSKFGKPLTINFLQHAKGAFVEYVWAASATVAMKTLQGTSIRGERMIIRFHDNNVLTENLKVIKATKSISRSFVEESMRSLRSPERIPYSSAGTSKISKNIQLHSSAIGRSKAEESKDDEESHELSSLYSSTPSSSLVVENIAEMVTLRGLKFLFSLIGQVKNLDFRRFPRKTGYAFVEYFALSTAVQAMANLDGMLVEGKCLSLKYKRDEELRGEEV